MRIVLGISRAVVTALALVTASSALAADEGTWAVSKSSGEVWMGSGDVQRASLKSDDVLKPGDTIRTGRNGRVLLVRGEESIMIAPNSVVGLPAEKKEGLSTTIIQKAGSILLEVEKKNVKHFEVETPYLAAVVKGTQFKVTVTAKGTTVDVSHGQVEVSDFKSGQIAQVMPGQHATVFAHGNAGLSLGGSGILQPIEHGKPRASSFDRVPVPRTGLTGKPTSASLTPHKHGVASTPRHGVTRISGALGEVKLNVHKVTHGLARSSSSTMASRSADRNNSTVWGSGNPGNNSASGSNNGNYNGNNSGTANNSSGGNSSVASTVAAIVGSGNGGGNNGNANGNNAGGNGKGNHNNAHAGGNGNGNENEHGNGNGKGNGHALGHKK
jgi:hypothetical protein